MEESAQTLGKYNLVRHLATGGMAEIWLAEQEGPGGFNKQVVIKRVLQHLARDAQFTQMFLDEARLVAQLTHPNIGQIYELGEIDGSYFIAMEYIEGMDMHDMIACAGELGQPIPASVAAAIMIQVLQALEYAHDFTDRAGNHVGLVHRDVTPHNVLVSNDGVAKLVDFGVAKAKANHSKTQTGAVKGKFAYMAPEQINSAPDLDRRVDVFAAGVVLYELLVGQKPFGDDLFAVNAIMNKPTPDPREVRPDVPESLSNIIKLALAKNRDDRYQSAQSMMHDLEDFMRATNAYVSQRDLAAYVRGLQGKEMTATWDTSAVKPGPRARITEKSEPVGTPTLIEEAPVVNVPQPVATPTPTSPAPIITAATQSVGGGMNLALVGVFGVVIVLILGAAGVAGLLIVSDDDGGKKKGQGAKVTETTKANKPTKSKLPAANPGALRHPDGGLVTINSNKKAHVFYEGVYIGDTDLQTTLRPGEYTLDFEAGKSRKSKTFEVKASMGIQQVRVKF